MPQCLLIHLHVQVVQKDKEFSTLKTKPNKWDAEVVYLLKTSGKTRRFHLQIFEETSEFFLFGHNNVHIQRCENPPILRQ